MSSFTQDAAQENLSIAEKIANRGVSRRDFLRFCGLLAAALALPLDKADAIASSFASTTPQPVIWLELGDCTGDSEAFLRSGFQTDPLNGGNQPKLTDLLLDVISLKYHELLMAPAGYDAEKVRTDAISTYAGKYILVVEGAIPAGASAAYCVIGGKSAESILKEAAANAAVIIAIGSCAVDGGISAARPAATGAVGVSSILPAATNLINIPGCPANPANVIATIVYTIANPGNLPPLDDSRRPIFAFDPYSNTHDHCQRLHPKDPNKHVVFAWDDGYHHRGNCLRFMGCRGPYNNSNCWSILWNEGTCWPIQAGHGCIGCTNPNFWDTMTPFYIKRYT